MKLNLHPLDRLFRISLGAILLILAFFNPGELWYIAGLVPLMTGAAGMCPVYRLLNISTKSSRG